MSKKIFESYWGNDNFSDKDGWFIIDKSVINGRCIIGTNLCGYIIKQKYLNNKDTFQMYIKSAGYKLLKYPADF